MKTLEDYTPEVNSIISHAKSIGYNPETDDIMSLIRSWIESGRKFCVAVSDNTDDAIRVTKQYL